MKIRVALYLLLIAGPVSAQSQAPQPAWEVTVKVIDEDSSPIAGANVGIGYYYMLNPKGINGVTDSNGIFVASEKGGGLVSCDAQKAGYYRTSGLQFDFKDYVGDQWQPWNTNGTLLLRKIGQPTPMYAKRYVLALKVPEYNKSFGYDLSIGDWVAPNGKGVSTDVLFQKDYHDDYAKITVRFPNTGDGIQVFAIPDDEKGSALRSPHEAPLDGYQPELIREVGRLPGQPAKFEYDPKRVYLFRVRTTLDERGAVKSALYGKIYGDFMQFTYYLNPTPNDRNLEFDPKHNLLAGQDITEP